MSSMLNEVKETVVSGKMIYIRGFGTFGPKVRKQKIGQDIRLRKPVVILPEASRLLNQARFLGMKSPLEWYLRRTSTNS